MSLQPNLRDDLLSGYLDSRLSPDERERIERMLKSDPAIRAHLAALKQVRERLRNQHQTSQSVLSTDFAERVVRATFLEAQRTNLPATHPVQLAVAAADRGVSKESSRIGWLALAGVLAASVALVITLTPGKTQSTIARSSADPTGESNPDIPVMALDSEPSSAARIATVETPASVETAVQLPEMPKIESKVARSEPTRTGDSEVDPVSQPTPKAIVTNPKKRQLKMMMAYEVRLENFEDLSPIESALASAGVSSVKDATVNSGFVDRIAKSRLVATEANGSNSEGVQILVIEAPAKQVSRFLTELSSGAEGVQRFGFSLLTDQALIQAAIEILDAGPQGATSSVRRINREGATEAHRFHSAQDGIRFTPGSLPASSKSLGDDGPDFLSSIILLVR